MTEAAQEFVTPLSVGALAGEHAFTDLFDARSEFDVGHIRLARDADLIVVAPATADLMAKMADGHADDLASAVLLADRQEDPARAGDEPAHVGEQGDAAQPGAARRRRRRARRPERRRDGRERRGRRRPHGRAARDRRGGRGAARGATRGALAGRRVLVTSGPTHEPIDPVRYIANRSSGKQGHAIAEAAAAAGADVTLVSGPVNVPDPPGVKIVKVETARDMLAAVEAALPADVAVFAAAVARASTAPRPATDRMARRHLPAVRLPPLRHEEGALQDRRRPVLPGDARALPARGRGAAGRGGTARHRHGLRRAAGVEPRLPARADAGVRGVGRRGDPRRRARRLRRPRHLRRAGLRRRRPDRLAVLLQGDAHERPRVDAPPESDRAGRRACSRAANPTDPSLFSRGGK